MVNRVVFRADGNKDMGLGHVIRSLALMDILRDYFECVFVIRNPSVQLKGQISELCSQIIELEEKDFVTECDDLIRLVFRTGDIVVLDGYAFNTRYQEMIKPHVKGMVCIDDIHTYSFVSDVVINHAPGLDRCNYDVSPHTRLLLGTKYALLRRPFLEAASNNRIIEEISKVFVCIGGADPRGLGMKIVKALSLDKQIEKIHWIQGAAQNAVTSQDHDFDEGRIHRYRDLGASEMLDLMQQCNLAVAPASTICYELAAVKMPILCGYFVKNQQDIYQGFLHDGAIIGMGDLMQLENHTILEEIDSLRHRKNFHTYMAVQADLYDAHIAQRHLETFLQLC